jgi:hypothetical protein
MGRATRSVVNILIELSLLRKNLGPGVVCIASALEEYNAIDNGGCQTVGRDV